ncbi:tRNA pseudouridine(38-40) synthase TruA [Ectobacillus ponti]|uniref:tRNA pseudouridine synthase A n=1 Tax=Ectobacillus ponti TaxID=2961894 RepID=A0AA41X919_9BACI|nr:tRNA pseudouridine(38-40) synthase TruA [Ectobacillus ponti]MCP8971144.1 tRNA pseudouridine(38-40) synthase TruA [Ectobacillus ponti]
MQRWKCVISYDGTGFAGYQVQQDQRTVQEEIEKVLKAMHKGEAVRIHGSGRTDASVHAEGQVIHFDSPLNIPPERWPTALNAKLPPDIVVKHAEKVEPNFHSRFDVVSKEYRYHILRTPQRNVFQRHYAYYYPLPLDLPAMQKAAGHLVGTHDFTAFCSARSEVEDKVRTIYELEIVEEADKLVLRFVGNGFLYNMVRILTGTLLEVGRGKIKPDELPSILEQRDRSRSGDTAPGHGLYLWQVNYNN